MLTKYLMDKNVKNKKGIPPNPKEEMKHIQNKVVLSQIKKKSNII